MSDYNSVRSYIEIEHLKTMSYEEINNVLTDQKNRIDELENKRDDGWISVDVSLPDFDIEVLGYFLSYGTLVTSRVGNRVLMINGTEAVQATHWKPLPEPPEVD